MIDNLKNKFNNNKKLTLKIVRSMSAELKNWNNEIQQLKELQ